jgi:hypothetical protein
VAWYPTPRTRRFQLVRHKTRRNRTNHLQPQRNPFRGDFGDFLWHARSNITQQARLRYRHPVPSIILYPNKIQKTIVEQVIKELTDDEVYGKPILTAVVELKVFCPAETYPKDYFTKHPNAPYCQVVITPKIATLQKTYLSKLKRNNL